MDQQQYIKKDGNGNIIDTKIIGNPEFNKDAINGLISSGYEIQSNPNQKTITLPNGQTAKIDSFGNLLDNKTGGIVSSAQGYLDQNSSSAINNGLKNLTGYSDSDIADVIKPYTTSGVNINPDNIKSFLAQGMNINDAVSRAIDLSKIADANTLRDRELAAQDAKYKAQNESQSAEYKIASQELLTQKSQDLSKAKAIASQLNPYGGANTDEANFMSTIETKYSNLQMRLDAENAKAKAAIESGNSTALQQIESNIQQIKSQGMSDINNLMKDIQTRTATANQFEKTYKEKLLDDYRTSLTTMVLPDPADIAKMDDKQIVASSWGKIGLEAGLTPEQMRNDALQGSFKAKNLTIAQTRALIAQQNSAIAQERMNMAAEKMYKAQTITNNISSTRQNLLTQGIGYDDPRYAIESARASFGGTKVTQEDVRTYTDLDMLSRQLPNVYKDLTKLPDGALNPLLNAFNTYIKNPYATNLATVNNELSGLATVIGKGLQSQVGNMSDRDVRNVLASIGGTSDTKVVREKLFNNLMRQVSEKATAKLNADASAGKDVSNYVPTIEAITNKFSGVTPSKTSSGYSPSFDVSSFITNLPKK